MVPDDEAVGLLDDGPPLLLVGEVTGDRGGHLIDRCAHEVPLGLERLRAVHRLRDDERPIRHPEDEAIVGEVPAMAGDVDEDSRSVQEPRAVFSPVGLVVPGPQCRHLDAAPTKSPQRPPATRYLERADEEHVDVTLEAEVAGAMAGRHVAKWCPPRRESLVEQVLLTPARRCHEEIGEALRGQAADPVGVAVDIGDAPVAEKELDELPVIEAGFW